MSIPNTRSLQTKKPLYQPSNKWTPDSTDSFVPWRRQRCRNVGKTTASKFIIFNLTPDSCLVPRAFSSKWRGMRRNTWSRPTKNHKNPGVFCPVKHNKISPFRLNKGFRLLENNRGYQSLEITSENIISLCVVGQNTPQFLEYFGSL